MCAASVFKYRGSAPVTHFNERRQPEAGRSASKDPTMSAGAGPGIVAFIARLAIAIDLWLEKRKQIGALRELTDDQLSDIGLTRRDVQQASAGAFWDYKNPHS